MYTSCAWQFKDPRPNIVVSLLEDIESNHSNYRWSLGIVLHAELLFKSIIGQRVSSTSQTHSPLLPYTARRIEKMGRKVEQ
jgi:hypothetical protein